MNDVGGMLDINTLEARPRWWIPRAIRVVAIVVMCIGAVTAIGTAVNGAGGDDASRNEWATALGPALGGTLIFLWYFVSSCFWSMLVYAAASAFDKLDELVWLQASEKDRIAIYRKRRPRDAEIAF